MTTNNWTYGAEHELADWDTRLGWEGYGRDPEPNICNSNGVAADPALKSYPFGAEINTPPTSSLDEQVDLLLAFLKKHPRATVNYRTGMHVHIRVPGLSKDLRLLKRLQRYITDNTEIYDLIDPLPVPTHAEFPIEAEYKAARRRYNWMRMSHFTRIPTNRVDKQCAAKTLDEFFRAEVPVSRSGQTLWHAQPRAAVNLRQLLQTDTIEFRHFPGVLDPTEFLNALLWCRDYLLCAFDGTPAQRLFESKYKRKKFPTLDTIYVPWMEKRWLATTISKVSRSEVEDNVRKILDGEFDEIENPYHLIPNPRGLDCY